MNKLSGKKKNVSINTQITPESSLIKKYVCKSPDSASMAPTSIAAMGDTTLQLI